MDYSPPGSFNPRDFPGKNTGVPLSSPGDLSDPGIEPVSPALAGGFFTTESKEAQVQIYCFLYWYYSLYNFSHVYIILSPEKTLFLNYRCKENNKIHLIETKNAQ